MALDLVGEVYGRLLVVKEADRVGQGIRVWECICECGVTVKVRQPNLRSGNTKSCGCYGRDSAQIRLTDLTGSQFGRLTVLQEAEVVVSKTGKSKWRSWLCKCSCGETTRVMQTNLVRGLSESCGCLSREVATKHSMSGTRQYNIWKGMKSRCDYESNPKFHLYGGRGVAYHSKWTTFEGFWEDMQEGYEDGLTLDRVDPDGDYDKENCRWVTTELQNRNLRKSELNTSGVTGVYWDESRQRWMAGCTGLNGERIFKTFPLSKYGEEAFLLACKCRAEMISELNRQGAGYTETHGQ